MAKPWSVVEQSEEYKNLPPQAQVQAKREYWDTVVSTKPEYTSLPPESQGQAQKEFFGGRIDDFTPTIEEQNPIGQVFNVPGAAIRSAIQGKGYTQGAVNPSKVPKFQDLAIQKAQFTTSPTANILLGMPASAAGLAADVVTDPLSYLPGAIAETGAGKAVGAAIATTKPAKAITEIATKERELPAMFLKGQARVDRVINHGISKAISPSVSGKGQYPQTKKYYDNANEAVKTIVENKDILNLPNENGLPQNLSEFADAIHQTKSHIYTQWDDLLKQSGKEGAVVDLEPIAKDLDTIINSKTAAIKNPRIIEDARGLQDRLRVAGKLSVKDADELIKSYNNTLQAFYRNPTYDHAVNASMDALVVNKLRSSLDDAVSSATGQEFQPLKNKYGALKAIEKDVNRRMTVDARKNIKGLIDFTDISSAADILRGVATMDPATATKGLFQHAVKEQIKKINNPNNIVRKMFEDVAAHHEPRPKSYFPEIMRRMPISKQKLLLPPQPMSAIGYETKAIPPPSSMPSASKELSIVDNPRPKVTFEEIKKRMQMKSKGKILRSQGSEKVYPKQIIEK